MRMIPRTRRFRRLSLALLLLSSAPAALAQYPAGAVVQSLPSASDPAELLARALRTLSVAPNDVDALTAAGTNALALGDPNAAVGFLGRAEQIAPGNGRVKAGLGSALVQLEKPQDALRLFGEASRLGVPDLDIAEDRGLAYDLIGDPRRAQKDYGLVLAAHPEDDTARRRLALSQGISGDKATAIATLDPLIRKRDIAGWRAQTFVLAMDGDTKGASDITHIMLPTQADMLQPFLERLAKLSPADRAKAVHFGEMPQAGTSYTATQLANIGTTPTYAAAPPARAPRSAPVAPHSDLAPVRTAASAPQASAPAPAAQTEALAAAQDIYRQAPPITRTTMAGPPAPNSAPLAGIALTPAAAPPAATTVPRAVTAAPVVPQQVAAVTSAPVSQPAQVAQAGAAPPMPSAAESGHYDLPHVAAERSGARAVSVAPKSAPVAAASLPKTVTVPPEASVEAKTIGTPVVHGRIGEDAPVAAKVVAEPVKVETPVKAKSTKLASETGDDDAKPKAVATKAVPDGDGAPAKGKSAKGVTKLATADTDDDAAKGKGGKAAAKSAKSDSAEADDGAKATHKGKSGKAAIAADDDGTTASGRKGKSGKTSTRLASADKDDESGKGASKKGSKSKEDDGDETASKSSTSKKGKAEEAKAAEPKVYVQVAGGANKDDMDKAWAGVKKKAPDLMKGRTPSTTPLKATNRLLVGPFKDEAEAQAFVNKMAGKGVSGFTFKSGKGQKVDKVDAGQ